MLLCSCSIMPAVFPMGQQCHLLCLKSPGPVSCFSVLEVAKEKLLLAVNQSENGGRECLNIYRALCL